MLRIARLAIIPVAILLSTALGPILADKPTPRKELQFPDQVQIQDSPKINDESATAPEKEKIRQALNGTLGQPRTGGVLDDVLEVIKQRGSILDGSSLDDQPPKLVRPSTINATSNSTIDSQSSSASASTKAFVAEQLLKTSRMLESVANPDRQRKALIQQMRGEAVKLLSE